MGSYTRTSKYTKKILEDAVAHCDTVSGVLIYLGIGPRGGSHRHISRKIREFGILWPHYKGTRNGRGGYRLTPEMIFNSSRKMSTQALRRALFSVGVKECCAECGLPPYWNEKFLRLQIDHIDGNYCNNNQGNLRFLCPNCHTQTDTFGVKNQKLENRVLFAEQSQSSSEVEIDAKPAHQCQVCNSLFKPSNVLQKTCSRACMGRKQAKVNWPSPEELRVRVWEVSTQTVGRELGVTGNSVKKHCEKLGIVVPPRGYFQKLRAPELETVRWPSKDELIVSLETTPLSVIAAKLGVTAKSVASHCKRLGIPLPPKGFWAKKGARWTPSSK